jgi:hypothetical protein
MRGFSVGDKVTTSGGYDEAGPWAQMGYGIVVGPDSKKKGYVIVRFAQTDETFSLKASNLRHLAHAAKHRSTLQKSSSLTSIGQEGLKPADRRRRSAEVIKNH